MLPCGCSRDALGATGARTWFGEPSASRCSSLTTVVRVLAFSMSRRAETPVENWLLAMLLAAAAALRCAGTGTNYAQLL